MKYKTPLPSDPNPIPWTYGLNMAVDGGDDSMLNINGSVNPMTGFEAYYDIGMGFWLDFDDDFAPEYKLNIDNVNIGVGFYGLLAKNINIELYTGVLDDNERWGSSYNRLTDYSLIHLQLALDMDNFYMVPIALGYSGVSMLIEKIENKFVADPEDNNAIPYFYAMIVPSTLKIGEMMTLNFGARYSFPNFSEYDYGVHDESLVLGTDGKPLKDENGNLIRDPSVDPRYDLIGMLNASLGFNLEAGLFSLDIGGNVSYGAWMKSLSALLDVTVGLDFGKMNLEISGDLVSTNLKNHEHQLINGYFHIGQDFDLHYDFLEGGFLDKNGIQDYLIKEISGKIKFDMELSDTMKLKISAKATQLLDNDGQEDVVDVYKYVEQEDGSYVLELVGSQPDPYDNELEIDTYVALGFMMFEKKLNIDFILGYDFKYEIHPGYDKFEHNPYLGVEFKVEFKD